MERHNIRSEHGITNGQFISVKRKKWRDNIIAAKKKKLNETTDQIEDNLKYTLSGRRIVELGCLGDELWCTECDIPLSLRNVEKEYHIGLVSELHIRCTGCASIKRVFTGKRKDCATNRYRYDVNFKLGVAILDAGIGEAQLNTILSALNIPAVSKALLKRHERDAGLAIEKLAKQSCQKSIRSERELTIAAETQASSTAVTSHEIGEHSSENMSTEVSEVRLDINANQSTENSDSREKSSVALKASYDAGWQKRGTGHSYNSLTGHASLIGYYSGKVLAYATRTKKCAKCDSGHVKTDHDCRLNFDRSAKAMEPDMAVELITKNELLNGENVSIAVIIGDDDASSIAAVRREASHRIEKWSDVNHAKKGFTSALYACNVPRGIIDYAAHSFSCALHQNKGDAMAVRAALLNIVDHAYGNHEKCGDWCRSHTDRNYVYKRLPGGKPLTDPELRLKLTSACTKYAHNADKLAPCGSSQPNESFNRIVCSKHPKAQFYGASESMAYRVAAAVCHKNIGTTYVSRAFEILNLSPGKQTTKYREMKDKARLKKSVSWKSVEFKRRRLFIAKNRTKKNAGLQRKEGITYETECALDGVSDLLQDQPNQSSASDVADLVNSRIVLFDLETSGLSSNAEICQISAASNTGVFNVYTAPKNMTPAASAITGLHVEMGELYLNDKRLDTVPPRVACMNFIAFLRGIGNNIILVAHNGFRFDAPMILRHMRQFGLLTEFMTIVRGFADTLSMFRDTLKDRRKEKKKFSLTALAFDFLGSASIEGVHDAQVDVNILRRLMDKTGLEDSAVISSAKSVKEFLQDQERLAAETMNKTSMQSFKPGVSAGMITKMAKAGISRKILQDIYANGGESSIRMLLGEDVGGRPRVTKNARVVKAILDQLSR